jgi:hypothetical protein
VQCLHFQVQAVPDKYQPQKKLVHYIYKGDLRSKPMEMAVLCTTLVEMAQQAHHKDQWSVLGCAHWLALPIILTYKLYPFFSGTAILIGLHDPEDGGTILLKNISDYLPANTS